MVVRCARCAASPPPGLLELLCPKWGQTLASLLCCDETGVLTWHCRCRAADRAAPATRGSAREALPDSRKPAGARTRCSGVQRR